MYRGEWAHDRASGTGTCAYSNGDKYTGAWFQDRAHGKGVYTYSGGELYDGDWVHGKKTGRGVKHNLPPNFFNAFNASVSLCNLQVFEFGNGDIYKGDFLDDDIHGEGSRSYADGGRYAGSFKVPPLPSPTISSPPRQNASTPIWFRILTIYRVGCGTARARCSGPTAERAFARFCCIPFVFLEHFFGVVGVWLRSLQPSRNYLHHTVETTSPASPSFQLPP
jgi:hypothetical protein